MQRKCYNIILRKSVLADIIKKIGNSIILWCLGVFVASYASEKIELTLSDAQGRIVNVIAPGQLVHLKVKITGEFNNNSLDIPGTHDCFLEPRGTYKTVYSINGVTTRSVDYNYAFKTDREGLLTLGPITLVMENKKVESNIVTVAVKKGAHTSEKNADIFLEFFSEKKQIYVGQKNMLKLRLYSCQDMELMDIKLPQFDKSFKVSPISEHKEGKKIINNKEYVFYEWDIVSVAHQPGIWNISPAQALCNIAKDSLFSHARKIGATLLQFGFPGEQKRFYSQPFSLEVLPLPKFDKRVHAIGVFDQIMLALNKEKILEGDAVSVKLSVVGQGDLESIKRPNLIIPEGLRSYESKAETHAGVKVFEYIIQGINSDEYTIAVEEFIFFNPQTAEYESLVAQEQKLLVEPNTHANVQLITLNNKQEIESIDTQCNVITAINEEGPWHIINPPALAWNSFFVCVIVCIIWIIITGYLWCKASYNKAHSSLIRKKNAFCTARNQLRTTQKDNVVDHIYTIFINLFADYTNACVGTISEESITELLYEAGFSEDMMGQWHRFFYEIASNSFSQNSNHSHTSLFKRAFVWVDQLEKQLC